MRTYLLGWFLGAVAIAVSGCPSPPPPLALPRLDSGTAGDAGIAPGVSTDSGAREDAGESAPRPLEMQIEIVIPDGGFRFTPDGGPIPIQSSFLLSVPVRVPGLRVRLADASGHAVDSHDQLRLSSTTTYELVPAAPLEPGTAYTLDVGPNAATQALADDRGRAFSDARVSLVTAGEKPKPKPSKHHRPHKKVSHGP
jgi:hypothetical protein